MAKKSQKKNQKYWKERAAKDMVSQMEKAEVTSEELASIYKEASRELIDRVNKTFTTYADRWNLTEEEATELLNGVYDVESLRNALKNAKGEEYEKLVKKLEGGAYGARIRRLEELERQINELSKDLYLRTNISTTNLMRSLVNDAYYRKIWDIQLQVGFDFSFAHINPNEVNRILSMNWSGRNYSQTIWNNTSMLATRIKKDMVLTYLTGKPTEELAQKIAKDFSVGAYEARRVVRTESAYVCGQADVAAYKEADIEEYQIIATLDMRTSKICQELDLKKFPLGKEVVGKNYPPFHPFCRTTTRAIVDGQVSENLKRRARNPVTGKNELVPADTDYAAWKKMHGLK